MTDGMTDPEDASAAALNIAGNCNFSFLHSPVNSAIRIPGHSPAQGWQTDRGRSWKKLQRYAGLGEGRLLVSVRMCNDEDRDDYYYFEGVKDGEEEDGNG